VNCLELQVYYILKLEFYQGEIFILEDNFDSIGKRIQALRETQNLKRKDIATILGISEGNLYSMENDKTHPSAAALMKLAKYFKVTSDWILFGDQQPEKAETITDAGFNVIVPDMELAQYFAKIVEEWKNGDERIKGWVIVQLQNAFPNVAKKLTKKLKKEKDK
jgi:transcriptional regulator with XRE-family HTH domain